MKLSTWDYGLAIVGWRMAPVLRHFGDMESDLAGSRLRKVAIDRPLFIAGLARSGSTVLLELLAQAGGVATHQYRDFPFLWSPIAWNWFIERAPARQQPVERPHKDGILITRNSPEAFEEPIWQLYFPWVHDPEKAHVLDSNTTSPEFEAFFRDHIRKILLIRKGQRYLSKGNYNIARLEYLAKLFPDARFLVPIRSPYEQVCSLLKQHRLFVDYARVNPRIPNYLRATGHFEFGPQRQPINLTESGAERVRAAWEAGDDALGYAVLWSEIYGYVRRIAESHPSLASRILIVRHEDLCANPRETIGKVLDFSELSTNPGSIFDSLDRIGPPVSRPMASRPVMSQAARDEIVQEASLYGYDI